MTGFVLNYEEDCWHTDQNNSFGAPSLVPLCCAISETRETVYHDYTVLIIVFKSDITVFAVNETGRHTMVFPAVKSNYRHYFFRVSNADKSLLKFTFQQQAVIPGLALPSALTSV